MPPAQVRGQIKFKRPPNVKLGANHLGMTINHAHAGHASDKNCVDMSPIGKKWIVVSDGRGDLGIFEDRPQVKPGAKYKGVDSRLRGNDGESGNDRAGTFGPEDVLHYIYAVFHSPEYRRRYAEFLKIDLPRAPLPKGKALFRKLCEVGRELTGLHLLEAEAPEAEGKVADFKDVEDSFPLFNAAVSGFKRAFGYFGGFIGMVEHKGEGGVG
jgi:hypothetical protein